jgi:hypothetical protein
MCDSWANASSPLRTGGYSSSAGGLLLKDSGPSLGPVPKALVV